MQDNGSELSDMNKFERAHQVPDKMSGKNPLSMHIFINFTTLGIEVIRVFRKIFILRIRNQKELENGSRAGE